MKRVLYKRVTRLEINSASKRNIEPGLHVERAFLDISTIENEDVSCIKILFAQTLSTLLHLFLRTAPPTFLLAITPKLELGALMNRATNSGHANLVPCESRVEYSDELFNTLITPPTKAYIAMDFLPQALLLLKTALPPLVALLTLNPCFLALANLLGW